MAQTIRKTFCNAGELGSIPESGRSPWRREWQPIPVFLPGEFHGQSSLAGYSPQGPKALDMTEWLTHMHVLDYFNQWYNSSSLSLPRGRDIRPDRLWKVPSLPLCSPWRPLPFRHMDRRKIVLVFFFQFPLVAWPLYPGGLTHSIWHYFSKLFCSLLFVLFFFLFHFINGTCTSS